MIIRKNILLKFFNDAEIEKGYEIILNVNKLSFITGFIPIKQTNTKLPHFYIPSTFIRSEPIFRGSLRKCCNFGEMVVEKVEY